MLELDFWFLEFPRPAAAVVGVADFFLASRLLGFASWGRGTDYLSSAWTSVDYSELSEYWPSVDKEISWLSKEEV